MRKLQKKYQNSDPWSRLRKFTQAKIGLGSAGPAVRTSYFLEFQLAHAQARDTVHLDWDVGQCQKTFQKRGLEAVILGSAVHRRLEYLTRPDLGRKLASESEKQLKELKRDRGGKKQRQIDVALVVSNGLSTLSIERHGVSVAFALAKGIEEAGWRISPLILIPNARVAISDQVGELLRASLSIIIIGERPGLTASDSLAIYLTYNPRVGNTDGMRNCISNIRPPEGLDYGAAVHKAIYLIREAMRRKYSGVMLKDETETQELPGDIGGVFAS